MQIEEIEVCIFLNNKNVETSVQKNTPIQTYPACPPSEQIFFAQEIHFTFGCSILKRILDAFFLPSFFFY